MGVDKCECKHLQFACTEPIYLCVFAEPSCVLMRTYLPIDMQISKRELARICGYGSNADRLRSLADLKANSDTVDELVSNLAQHAKRKERKDKLTGLPIWQQLWHHFTTVKKGQKFRSKMICNCRTKDVTTGKYVWKSEWERHAQRYMVYKIAEIVTMMKKWNPYMEWRTAYLALNPRLPSTWHVSAKRLYKERCFCVDSEEQVRKMGCGTHLKMQELVAGLQKWRRDAHKRLPALLNDDYVAPPDDYFEFASSLSNFADHVCPCERTRYGHRKLDCVIGNCDVCRDIKENLVESPGEERLHESLPVKYKWLRNIQIGGRQDTEWAWMSKPYGEFMQLLTNFYQDSFRLHHWVYRRQDHERRQCRRHYKKGEVVIELDYAAKLSMFEQDAMSCSASKQTSNFIVFCHFDPVCDETGKNIDDTTEVFAFHSDCTKQDTHSIRRFLTHVLENMLDRHKLWRKLVHFFMDGSAAQNKGRKAVRQMSELSMLMGLNFICNFACTEHFGGPWDTDGGRQARAIKLFIQNGRGDEKCESVTCAGDIVRVLRRVLNKAGEPDPPISSQKSWRPAPQTDDRTATPATSATPVTAPQTDDRTATPAASATPATTTYTSRPRCDKAKKQRRGRTDAEMQAAEDAEEGWYRITRRHILYAEPCPCHRACKCPSDGRLTYKRDESYDSTPVKGTLTTYCFAYFKRALRVSVRQYSCYCRWCAKGEWAKCVDVATVRHAPSRPVRPLDPGHTVWTIQGWREVQLRAKSPADPAVTRVAVQSVKAAREYVSKLRNGTTIAFMGKNDGHKDFWLASKQSDIRKAERHDPTTGIKKGEEIISIIWYDRVAGLKYQKEDYETVVSVSSVLVTVSNITWQRTTTNRFYLSETFHEKLTDLVSHGSEI